jgi:hypothetical protein
VYVCVCVRERERSRSLKYKEAVARLGPQRHKKKIVPYYIRFVVTARIVLCVRASVLSEITVLLNFMNMLCVSCEYSVCGLVACEFCGGMCEAYRAVSIGNRFVGGECPEVPGMSR